MSLYGDIQLEKQAVDVSTKSLEGLHAMVNCTNESIKKLRPAINYVKEGWRGIALRSRQVADKIKAASDALAEGLK